MKAKIALAVVSMTTLWASPAALSAELTPERRAEAEALIRQLGDDAWKVRRKATDSLIEMGPDVLPLVLEADRTSKDEEVKYRCLVVIERMRLVEKRLRDLGPPPPQGDDVFRRLNGPFRSWNGEQLVYVREVDGRKALVLNGAEGPAFDAVFELTFNWRAGRIAYAARQAGRGFIVLDCVEGTRYDGADYIRFSPDGKRVAFVARKDGKVFAVLDGAEQAKYDGLVGIRFSADGKRLLYAARRGDKWVMVVDGSEGPEHEAIHAYGDGTKPEYLYREGRTFRRTELVLPPAGPLPPRLGTLPPRLMATLPEDFAAPGVRLIAAGGNTLLFAHGGRWIIFCDGTVAARHGPMPNFCCSPDGRRLAFTATRDGICYLLLDGKESSDHEQIRGMTFSPDSRRFAFEAGRYGQAYAVIDGQKAPGGSSMAGICFSPDSRRVAYVADGVGGSTVFVDANPVGTYQRTEPPLTIADVVFSPDSSHVAWVVRRAKSQFIVCDGLEGPPHAAVTAHGFSPDGKHLYYVATDSVPADGGVRKESFVVLDGFPGPRHQQVIPLRIADPAVKAFRYAADDNGRQWLLEVDWPNGFDWSSRLKPAGAP